jgi:hypothetical protein
MYIFDGSPSDNPRTWGSSNNLIGKRTFLTNIPGNTQEELYRGTVSINSVLVARVRIGD